MTNNPIIFTSEFDNRRDKLIKTLYKLTRDCRTINAMKPPEASLKDRYNILIDTGVCSLAEIIKEKICFIDKETKRLSEVTK